MNQGKPAGPPPVLPAARADSDAASGRELVSAIKGRWARGAPADAVAVLSQHPELRAQKSAVLDLAYEEFCLRQEAGRPADPDEFCERFPAFKSSLRRLLEAHRCIAADTLPPAADRPTHWPEPGDSFLGFSLLRELGRGAFARVFLATEPALGNRLVAVKVSLQGAGEAAVLGRLEHGNVVPVHSVQKEDLSGWTVVCMPYLGSATLCDVLDRAFARPGRPAEASVILEAIQDPAQPGEPVADPRPPDSLLRTGTYTEGIIHIAAQLADALHFVHDRGVCHRDLKPSNVLMSPDGRPMLLDFNLAFDERQAEGRFGGTLPYMAPEQLLATDPDLRQHLPSVDSAADLFALGLIVHELLTGAHPFGPIPLNCSARAVRAHLLERYRAGPPSLRRANPQVDEAVARVVEQCLAYDPAARPASAAEVAAVFRRSVAWPRRVRRWIARHLGAVLAAAFLVLATGVAAASYAAHLRDFNRRHRYEHGLEAYRRQDYEQAVRYFSKVLEEDPAQRARALFARGRAYERLDKLPLAQADYEKAVQLGADGRVKACLAHCNNRRVQHGAAVVGYREAIGAGFEPAEVFNNLGYSFLRLGDLDNAERSLDRAIELAPCLQTAFHNRARVDLARTGKDPRHIPRAGLADICTALWLGPETTELCYDAARLYGAVAESDIRCTEPALAYLQKAVASGQDPQSLAEDPYFTSLRKDPRFRALLDPPVHPLPARKAVGLLDPVEDIPW